MFDRYRVLAHGLAVLLVADQVERWQRRVGAGDLAAAFWAAGLLATAAAYLAIWGRADDSWWHLLLHIALGLVALSPYQRRRLVLLAGVGGVVGYLGYLAEDVFRAYLSLPVLLAALGLRVRFRTVWTQLRFPALVARLEARRASDAYPLPWSAPMAARPLATVLALAHLAPGDAAEEREQQAFRERLHLLPLHSGSLPRAVTPRPAPLPAGAPPAKPSP